LLSLSRCIIKLSKSTSYSRLAFILSFFSAYLVINCQFWWLIKISLLGYLGFKFIYIYLNPFPYSDLIQFAFIKDEWILSYSVKPQLNYQKHRIVLDCGLFFLLEFSNETKRKIMVIFFDQLSPDDYRALCLIEKLR
jgi:hypothetical protein